MDYIQTPRDAEINAERILRSWGYLDAKVCAPGADGGVDVRSKDTLAQVKFYGTHLSTRPEVQNLYGSRGHGTQKLFFFTSIGYTALAVQFADKEEVALFIYAKETGEPQPANAVAHRYQPGSTHTRTWVSPDWVALLHGARALGRVLAPPKKRRLSTRKSAHR